MTTRASSSSSTGGTGGGKREVSFGAAAAPTRARNRSVYGTPMPFSSTQVAREFITARTVNGGQSATTRVVRLNGRDYIVKELQSYTPSTAEAEFRGENGGYAETQARNEEATVAGLHALGWSDLGPREAYAVRSNGKDYAVISREAGDSANASGLTRDEIAARVPVPLLQRAFVAEYLLGMRDRHGGNILYDRATNTVRQIDFGFGLKRNASLEGFSAVQELLHVNARDPQIDRGVLEQAVSRAGAVEHAWRARGATTQELIALRNRVRVLRGALDDSARTRAPITVSSIEREMMRQGFPKQKHEAAFRNSRSSHLNTRIGPPATHLASTRPAQRA